MKGHTNNPNGRPKGSKNKGSNEIRELISGFVGHNIETLQKDFEKLEPNQKLVFFEKILKYILPTMTHTHAMHDVQPISGVDPFKQIRINAGMIPGEILPEEDLIIKTKTWVDTDEPEHEHEQ